MKFHRLKNTVQLTSLIFMGIMVIGLAAGQTLNNKIVCGLLICSALAAILKSFLCSESLFGSSPLRQAVYLILVWLLFLLCSFLCGWSPTWMTAVFILAEVLIIYFAIRLINYQLVKIEVKRMNNHLEKPEQKEKKTSG